MPNITMLAVSKIAVVVAMALGIGMIVPGRISCLWASPPKGNIKEALRKEKVITSPDSAIPGVLVKDARTAKAQQGAIESHTSAGLAHTLGWR